MARLKSTKDIIRRRARRMWPLNFDVTYQAIRGSCRTRHRGRGFNLCWYSPLSNTTVYSYFEPLCYLKETEITPFIPSRPDTISNENRWAITTPSIQEPLAICDAIQIYYSDAVSMDAFNTMALLARDGSAWRFIIAAFIASGRATAGPTRAAPEWQNKPLQGIQHRGQLLYSTTICKLVDLIPALHQSDCRIPNWVSAKTVLSSSTNHGQTTAHFRSFSR